MPPRPTESQIVATETVVVHDDNLSIDRRIIAGQPVPPDLVAAYRNVVGDERADANPGDPAAEIGAPYEPPVDPTDDRVVGDYEDSNAETLEAEVARRRAAGREIDVEGTGSGGNVVKADLVAALKSDDESGGA